MAAICKSSSEFGAEISNSALVPLKLLYLQGKFLLNNLKTTKIIHEYRYIASPISTISLRSLSRDKKKKLWNIMEEEDEVSLER